MSNILCDRLNIDYPIIQAPMAGVSTPELAAAVSNAGALGSVSVGASLPWQAEAMIKKTQQLTRYPFSVNVFCHEHPRRNPQQEKAWIAQFRDIFSYYGAEMPGELSEIYQSFHDNASMLEVLLSTAPAAVSFHFGIPSKTVIKSFSDRGILTFATATNIQEALLIESAGIDFIVAQGIEAGGHRGVFNVRENDHQLSTVTLVQAIKRVSSLPVIGAGGIMDGAGIASMLKLGTVGVQMGTAFILCPESSANEAYRQALKSENASRTLMTSVISGRPARCISNDFCKLARHLTSNNIPSYPLTYALGKSLAIAAAAKGDHGFGAHWAGQGASLAREMAASDMITTLVKEWREARSETS
ncbi:nitronate monooxygenase [Citrobacter sp. JGM124]|uniref:NAD(P)H-dependent flavin oxidoreductase n=1 Tax=Citrobacter sp. JGM124 TaxID=2799789 RepID=UPI001BA7895D|nr:nitronate monooxygenase [Citrobacter sp. JGM124]MBS0847993.1 nitronate monooxygenase [Citrobacter sp. JGM124]